MLNVVWVPELNELVTGEVRELLLAARAVDTRPEVKAEGPLPGEFSGGLHLLGHDEGKLVGYAHLDTSGDAFGRQVAELIVHPDRRRQGVGTRLVEALVEKVGEPDKLRVWAHGDHPAAARIAERAGFARARELLVLHVNVAGADWPEPVLRDGVSLRTFVPGQDEQAVVDVNARAFDWHPEQGQLTVAELTNTERADWFDAEGFFLAEREGKLLGFHWTKIHPADPGQFGGEPVGEVYVVGVDPDAQGGGLGKALTLAGLRYLRDKGLAQVILYVEGDNTPAIAVYTKLGFTRYSVDVQYAR
ncbi:mycothiol synthase [Amycolatopsis sp.]|uniref:mycothiol synthase n=1 Tax=Amycolatopsis sp. TaxID=37632 RepID=UPI002B55DEEA|nr:mycothiol synthase [Amycolatopsis sp.]HVV13959.1 mycothiol synthase [Amycolatopsis sp.]